MSMNKIFFFRNEDKQPRWRVIDAQDKVVGRLATEIADALRGKDKAEYTPHSDAGDYVVVINAEKVVFTGDKMKDKEYVWYTGWIGGQKRLTARQMMQKDPARIIHHAVKGMLASSKLARAQLKKLKVYSGSSHPHTAQVATYGEK
jgi:large subunit ribosomal protein L13